MVGYVTSSRGREGGIVVAHLKTVLAVSVLLAPYLLYAIAQTSRLHDAVNNGDLNDVRSALKPWKSPNGISRHNRTPLALAIQRNDAESIKLLLRAGANVIAQKDRFDQPIDHLKHAVKARRPALVKLLLPHVQPAQTGEAFIESLLTTQIEIAKMMLASGVNATTIQTERKVTQIPAFYAVNGKGDLEEREQLVALLQTYGSNFTVLNSEGAPILTSLVINASKHRKYDAMRIMLDRGSPVDAASETYGPALYYAARFNDLDAMQLLLSHGADPDAAKTICSSRFTPRCKIDLTAMQTIFTSDYSNPDARARVISVLKLLISSGANVNLMNRSRYSALYFAVNRGNIEAARLLLDAGADPNLGSRSPLSLARMHKHREIETLLIAHGAK